MNTVTIHLDKDESLLYTFRLPTGTSAPGICKMRITPEVYERYVQIEADYFKMQTELENHYHEVLAARKKGNEFV